MIKEYIEYLKDNPEGYWFKRKLYGWGWTPATKMGWLVTLGYAFLVLALAFTLDANSSGREVMFTFVLPLILLSITLVRICYVKGEKPKWQWGTAKKDGSFAGFGAGNNGDDSSGGDGGGDA